jgi:hypothetical protein
LASPDGTEKARVLFRAGKNRDGYFYNNDIISQAETAFKLVTKYYPDDEHVFVYDNATTHLKRAENALSAAKMTKGPSAKCSPETNLLDDDGKPVYGPDGKFIKIKIQMDKGRLTNGEEQDFYYPDDHPQYPGYFKGMEAILKERGEKTDRKKAQCGTSLSKCPAGVKDCCLRQMMFNQPDFVEAESLLEKTAKSHGCEVFFLPKYHCELNPIEMCWGFAKRVYRRNPTSSKEEDLERNTVAALDSVPLFSMRRFTRRTFRFLEAYASGMDGEQAAWSVKKYKSHRVVPNHILPSN